MRFQKNTQLKKNTLSQKVDNNIILDNIILLQQKVATFSSFSCQEINGSTLQSSYI